MKETQKTKETAKALRYRRFARSVHYGLLNGIGRLVLALCAFALFVFGLAWFAVWFRALPSEVSPFEVAGGFVARVAVLAFAGCALFFVAEDAKAWAIALARRALLGRVVLAEGWGSSRDESGENDAEESGADGQEHREHDAPEERPEAVEVVAAGDGDSVHHEAAVEVPALVFVENDESAGCEFQGRFLLSGGDAERRVRFGRLVKDGFVVLVHAHGV